MTQLEGHKPVTTPAHLEGHTAKTKDNTGRELGTKAPPGPVTSKNALDADIGKP